ncbi:murein hydrolase activator EnvC [Microbacterium sp. 3J1]|uniref:murein hydrolase activator EnvC family protein n=1 Tax=Microbacterium sp. 3J1 TaxID=861269 RepID=UPI000B856E6F|nr:M23 family metallopeptidase [Microbacterium sp. 3J1]
MSTRTRPARESPALTFLSVLIVAGCVLGGPTAASGGVSKTDPVFSRWSWPVSDPHTITTPFRAPAHEYGAGHRGIDVDAPVGALVSAPAAGTVAYRGTVVDRPLLTIDHGGGYVSTFEPLVSALAPGDTVSVGEAIGTVAFGGHTAPGSLHIGVRLDGSYINPSLLFGEVPRAVLLPCCDPL